MKAVLNETKRILAVLLSVAMIFAYVPNNVMAYADEKTDENIEPSDVRRVPLTSGADSPFVLIRMTIRFPGSRDAACGRSHRHATSPDCA